MIRAYDKTYLSDAMYGMGAMLDYAVNSCSQPLDLFYARFLRSGVDGQIERGNPRYLGGLSGIELALIVADRTGSPLPEAKPLIDMGSPEFWTGWTLAYLQWYFGLSFRALQAAGIGADTLIARYPALHEADLSKAVSLAEKALDAHRLQDNPLKTQRKNARLTQRELAALSGTSLRAIRAYEQSQLSLSNASAESLRNLSHALGCTTEELLMR